MREGRDGWMELIDDCIERIARAYGVDPEEAAKTPVPEKDGGAAAALAARRRTVGGTAGRALTELLRFAGVDVGHRGQAPVLAGVDFEVPRG